jgi:LemA protein
MFELLIVVVVAGAAAVWIFNRLVSDRNQVLSAWSDIDVQLVRRHALVPQLVTTVKAYADYEKATMTAVTELRARSEAATHLPDKAAAEAQLAAAVNKLLVVAEAYPELKASTNFLQLQKELVEIEDHIQYARRFYNGAVRILNTRIQTFPHLLIAGPFGFKAAEYFEVDDARQRDAVRVELNP